VRLNKTVALKRVEKIIQIQRVPPKTILKELKAEKEKVRVIVIAITKLCNPKTKEPPYSS